MAGERIRSTAPDTPAGLDENVAGALSYLLGIVSGLTVYLLEPDNGFVRFHAAQSMVAFGLVLAFNVGLTVLSLLLASALLGTGGAGLFAFGVLSMAVGLVWLTVVFASVGLWLYLMVRAYQGRTPRVPVVAALADELV